MSPMAALPRLVLPAVPIGPLLPTEYPLHVIYHDKENNICCDPVTNFVVKQVHSGIVAVYGKRTWREIVQLSDSEKQLAKEMGISLILHPDLLNRPSHHICYSQTQ